MMWMSEECISQDRYRQLGIEELHNNRDRCRPPETEESRRLRMHRRE
jgi:hypothetical protein